MAPQEAIDVLTAAWAAEGRMGPVLLGLTNGEQLAFAARCGLDTETFLAAFRVIAERAAAKAIPLIAAFCSGDAHAQHEALAEWEPPGPRT